MNGDSQCWLSGAEKESGTDGLENERPRRGLPAHRIGICRGLTRLVLSLRNDRAAEKLPAEYFEQLLPRHPSPGEGPGARWLPQTPGLTSLSQQWRNYSTA